MKALRTLLISNPRALLLLLKVYCFFFGVYIRKEKNGKISIKKRNLTILISSQHLVYLKDIVPFFSFYFDACEPSINELGGLVVDYSGPKLQALRGYHFGKMWTPSLPDPIDTSRLYIEITRPKVGMTVLDLGTYGGLTAISFKEQVGASGTVVTVEADPVNYECASRNLESYSLQTGLNIELINAAVWSADGGVEFLAESGLGSAVAQVLPRSKNLETVSVSSMTLTSIAEKFYLSKVDILKADIEGAELEAFSDSSFFTKYQPVVIFEAESEMLEKIRYLISSYGYSCQTIPQVGSRIPIILCKPNQTKNADQSIGA